MYSYSIISKREIKSNENYSTGRMLAVAKNIARLDLKFGVHITLPVLYSDDYYVAVTKPCGLFVHRSSLSGERHSALQMVRDQLGQYVWPVHRLDRATSGVLLFGRSAEAASRLMQQWQSPETVKNYIAVVRGWLPQSGCVDYPLRKLEQQEQRQEAVTHYRSLGFVELPISDGRHETARYTLVELTLLTGRRHQLRRHMAHLRHPIIGDVDYGDGLHNRLFREQFLSHRLLLHALVFTFRHPFSEELVRIYSEADPDMQSLFAVLGWDRQLLL
jgi:tRNA pseudouridine65 synthase